jgi:hypothetical protein
VHHAEKEVIPETLKYILNTNKGLEKLECWIQFKSNNFTWFRTYHDCFLGSALKSLKLSGNDIFPLKLGNCMLDPQMIEFSKVILTMKHLTELDLPCICISTQVLATCHTFAGSSYIVESAKELLCLTTLNVSCQDVLGEGTVARRDNSLRRVSIIDTTIEDLDLTDNQLFDEELESLLDSMTRSRIKRLRLDYNEFGPKSMKTLRKLMSNWELVYLSISGCMNEDQLIEILKILEKARIIQVMLWSPFEKVKMSTKILKALEATLQANNHVIIEDLRFLEEYRTSTKQPN